MKSLSFKERFQLSRFFRGERPIDEPITLNHRRIFILPSQRGFGFVILIALLLLIAFVYNNNLAYLLCFLLASIFFVTILHSFRSLNGLVIQPGYVKPVFAGEPAVFEIHIDNPTATSRFNIQASLDNTVLLDISSNSRISARLFSSTVKRGWHDCGTITFSSTYPLGLFRAWSPLRFNAKALVYPKPWAHELPFPTSSHNDFFQGFVHKGADDFYGLQEYQRGDSIKHIHWKSYAKGLGVFSKQYSGEQGTELWLDYDATNGAHVDERLSQLCRWILDAEQAGLAYGLSLPGLKFAPALSQSHKTQCLEALALF